jgi:hypothetical protein
MDPITAFMAAQAAVAGIKKPLPLVKISTACIRSSAVSTKRQTQYT